MKTIHPLAGVLALAALLPAQQDPKPPKLDAPARLKALEAEAEATTAAWRESMRQRAEAARKAAAEGQQIPAMAMTARAEFAPLFPKFEAAAGDYAGTDEAVPFLIWLVNNGGGRTSEVARSAIATLTVDHAGSSAIRGLVQQVEFLPRMVGPEAADAFVAAVLQSNEDVDVLGWLALSQLGSTIQDAAQDSDAYLDAKARLLAHATSASDAQLKRKIQAAIDLREKYGVGATAPDVVGIDLDGVAFKLSDYEGKVVFLDFWGDW